MIYQGQFRNIEDELISVVINNNNGVNQTKNIVRENGLWFGAEPVVIEMDVDSTFEHILRKSATITLVTSSYNGGDLFAANARSVEVTITKGNEILFYGFLEPNTYSQGFAKPLEEFQLNCVDALSTLQYYKYNNISLTDFGAKRKNATIKSFKDLIDDCLDGINNGNIYYDLSKGINQQRRYNIFDDCGVSELYIIGEDYEDTWTREDVLNEIMKYLNLHIVQHGNNYYIFDWQNLRNGNTSWYNIKTDETVTLNVNTVTFVNAMHGADDTSITVGEVYNQISVKDELESNETVITSPLEKEDLNSVYASKQLYMTEYISEGSGDTAHDAMIDMLQGRTTTYKDAKQIDWFIQAMNSKNWKFYHNDGTTSTELDTLPEKSGDTYINQWKMAKYLKANQCVPYIFKLGSVEQKSLSDNSPVSKIDMTPYLFVSVNGNEIDYEGSQSPDDTTIENAKPIMEYVGNESGGVFSPADDNTINYLVFSGEMFLQPIVYESSSTVASRTNNYEDIMNNGMAKSEGVHARVPYYGYVRDSTIIPGLLTNNLVKSDNNTEGRYYVRKFYTQAYTNVKPTASEYLKDGSAGIQPWTEDKSAHGYVYNGSKMGDGIDTFTKLPILECELIIGNKRLIETDMDEYGNSTFQWVAIGSEPTRTYNGVTYPITTFSLGVNPKVGDYIIGQEYNIQNTIDYTMNLDTEGTAIPIKKSDALSGAVIFRVLGPINSIWNETVRRHPIFFNHVNWADDYRFILSHIENIIVKDLECKIYSDNAGFDIDNSNDLIYMSDETNSFVNKKDNIEFKFITQLTSAEASQKGVNTGINMNAVINMITNTPLNTLYNNVTTENAKAEEHYVDQYYREYSSPKILLTSTMHNDNRIAFNNLYTSTVLNKTFFIQSMNFDVKMNKNEITYKEI